MEAREEENVQERSGDKHSRMIDRRCESAGVVHRLTMVFTE